MIHRKKTARNFLVFAASVLYAFVFFSCKPQAETPYDLYQTHTLRSSALKASEATLWISSETDAADKMPQDERLIRLPGGKLYNTAALFITGLFSGEAVYPAAEGFTSLDTRMIPEDAYALCKRLIEDCKKKELAADFFSSGFDFLKIVYEYELRHLPDIEDGIIGKARIDDGGVLEVPLRLRAGADFIYLSVYLVRENTEASYGAAFKIEQIVFEEEKK